MVAIGDRLAKLSKENEDFWCKLVDREVKMNFVLRIPHLPPSELMINKLRTIHWTKRSAVEAEARKEGFYEAKRQWPDGWTAPDLAMVSYLFVLPDKRVRDVESMIISMKPTIDGCVDAQVIKSDDCWHLVIGGARAEYRKGVSEVVITICQLG